MNPPVVDFTIGGTAALLNTLNMRPLIDQAILDALNSALVLPKRLAMGVRCDEYDPVTDSMGDGTGGMTAADTVRPLPRGLLKIRVVEGKNLQLGGGAMLGSPFVELAVGSRTVKTESAWSNAHPKFEAETASHGFFVDIPELQTLGVKVEVYRSSSFRGFGGKKFFESSAFLTPSSHVCRPQNNISYVTVLFSFSRTVHNIVHVVVLTIASRVSCTPL